MKRQKTYHVISTSHVLSSALIIALASAAAVFCAIAFINYLDLPEVHVTPEGRCVRVVNFKNGDGFQCQDKDVVLRKYHLFTVDDTGKVIKRASTP